jgi:ribosomal protein S18 acetylase RimI-like enzyme
MEGADKDVIIRDATFSDIEPLTNLRPPRGLHADRIRDRFSSDARYVVAEVNGKPAAFGVIHFEGDPMWERPEQVPIVMDLYVAPDLRKRGIGRRVLAALEKTASDRGFSCVYLQVEAEKNPNAVELYRKLGYQPLASRSLRDPYHTVDDEGNVHEGSETVIDMRKLLG